MNKEGSEVLIAEKVLLAVETNSTFILKIFKLEVTELDELQSLAWWVDTDALEEGIAFQ